VSVVATGNAMTTLNLFTNIPVDPVIASDILRDATKAVAKIIGKPESVKPIFTILFLFQPFFIIHRQLFDEITL
jgi:hypothetical protein